MTSVSYDYDEKADVLYIFFGEHPRPCIDRQIAGGMYLSKLRDTQKICGITIVDFAKRCSIGRGGS